MAIKQPGRGRAVINELPHYLEILIPNRRNGLMIFNGFSVLVGGTLAFLLASRSKTEINLFTCVWWLGGITMMAFVIRYLLFAIGGSEEWRFDSEYFTRTLKRPWGRRVEEYPVLMLKGVRINEDYDYGSTDIFGHRRLDILNLNKGTVKFDYGRDTIRIGNGLSEAEARYIIAFLKERGTLTSENFYQ